ncbi:hypothetical protein [Francisella philomiragia]|uniref:Uncharacterized protein n=1 Tax=Francisella philomiragia TaxID=28110 RepID=A0ABS1GAG7_9GAMM|nr:hypothetical protein [Francisella philomiragia]MBK2258413.1 hypothetical protein [Francisella philomiragia]MBK2301789.1 hypothetical protein [Francisella philomiragia]
MNIEFTEDADVETLELFLKDGADRLDATLASKRESDIKYRLYISFSLAYCAFFISMLFGHSNILVTCSVLLQGFFFIAALLLNFKSYEYRPKGTRPRFIFNSDYYKCSLKANIIGLARDLDSKIDENQVLVLKKIGVLDKLLISNLIIQTPILLIIVLRLGFPL